uniref:Uncharacterized protein n=1 Tax=Anguilla anguilla TaxID=7936 RepID=A0A0E9W3W7_ANGAN
MRWSDINTQTAGVCLCVSERDI